MAGEFDLDLNIDVPAPDVNEVLRRGRILQRRQVVAYAGVVLVTCAVVGVVAFARPAPTPEPPPQWAAPATGSAGSTPTPGWTTHRDEENAYSVTYPSDWYRAPTALSSLSDPEEILALSTSELPPGGTCGPEDAARELTHEDVLIFLTEYRQDGASDRNFQQDFSPRGRTFQISTIDPVMVECIPIPVRAVSFSDHDRFFGMFVYIGPAASTESRQEVRTVLDSLKFDQR